MTQALVRIIRKKNLPDFVGLQRTQIEGLIAAGEFPRPIPLSDTGRAVGWLEHEVQAWQAARIAARAEAEASRRHLARRRPRTGSAAR
jgi:prophage regulatory protein